jgi:hypothetical protein
VLLLSAVHHIRLLKPNPTVSQIIDNAKYKNRNYGFRALVRTGDGFLEILFDNLDSCAKIPP